MDLAQGIFALVSSWLGSGISEAYWARQTTPGWPPAFHSGTPPLDHPATVLIPLVKLQVIGLVLGFAILCLIGVTLTLTGKRKKRTRP